MLSNPGQKQDNRERPVDTGISLFPRLYDLTLEGQHSRNQKLLPIFLMFKNNLTNVKCIKT